MGSVSPNLNLCICIRQSSFNLEYIELDERYSIPEHWTTIFVSTTKTRAAVSAWKAVPRIPHSTARVNSVCRESICAFSNSGEESKNIRTCTINPINDLWLPMCLISEPS